MKRGRATEADTVRAGLPPPFPARLSWTLTALGRGCCRCISCSARARKRAGNVLQDRKGHCMATGTVRWFNTEKGFVSSPR